MNTEISKGFGTIVGTIDCDKEGCFDEETFGSVPELFAMGVSDIVGKLVALNSGGSDGKKLEEIEGTELGICVGKPVGLLEGNSLGNIVGLLLGNTVGGRVGAMVGGFEG